MARTETFEGWREGVQDDLVLAVALAPWIAEKEPATVGGIPLILGVRGGVHYYGW
jgi:hypothetical protein